MEYIVGFLSVSGTFLEGYLAPLLTVFGWYILLVNTDRIALRTESRAAVDSCIKKLEDLLDTTSTYFHLSKKGRDAKYRYETSASFILSTIETKKSYLHQRTGSKFITDEKLALLRTLFVPSIDKAMYQQCIEEVMDTVELLESEYANRFGENWYQLLRPSIRVVLSIVMIILLCGLIIA